MENKENLLLPKDQRNTITQYLLSIPVTPLIGRNIANIVDILNSLTPEHSTIEEVKSDQDAKV